MAEALKYVRDYYDVPAHLGRKVVVYGRPGVIAADRGHYIGINFDDEKPGRVHNAHPTDGVQYGDMGEIRPVTRSQRRYEEFLEEDSGLSFGEWLKAGGGARA